VVLDASVDPFNDEIEGSSVNSLDESFTSFSGFFNGERLVNSFIGCDD
jgi:hypothetical protein